MAEQRLDEADVGAAFQEVRGETVPQGVDGDALSKVRGGTCGFQRDRMDRVPVVRVRKQPSHCAGRAKRQ